MNVPALPPSPSITPANGYAGDITPQAAWQLAQQGQLTLVDVRTDAERAWVGFVPGMVEAAWKQWPGMALNPHFDAHIRQAAAAGKPLALLCRSGVRSVAAARQASTLGLVAYSILGGFEGERNEQGQRGHLNGWRHAGLPWQLG